MKKIFALTAIAVLLAACAGTSSTGNAEIYGQISGGVETTFK
ncbi:hypothetical protein [Wielerella bovis]|nr:hypothetical protein [Wielerella bovis]